MKWGRRWSLCQKIRPHRGAAGHCLEPETTGITSAITGPRIPAQIEDTVKAADWVLTKEDIAEVEKLLADRLATLKLWKAI